MTSLALQLKRLKTAETECLAPEKDRSSLLFDAKEAAAYSREDFYEFAINGLQKLKKFDEKFDCYEADLFDKSCLNSNRALLGMEEHIELNGMLEKMIIKLSPYFHHQACKQVLEWLVYKYQVHRFNAELLFIAFLQYHSSNSFGRLLRILKFEKPEWNFVDDFARSGSPIPMNVLMKVCFTNRSYFLVSSFSSFLVKALQAVGQEYAEKRLHTTFTFYAIFMLSLFDDSSKVNDELIAKVMPYVGVALKSAVLPFKFAGLVIIAKMVVTTSLNAEILHNITKLILFKIREPWVDVALDTVALICQTQDIANLPGKSIIKLSRKRDALNLVSRLEKMASTLDISYFLIAVWNTLQLCLERGVDEDMTRDCKAMLGALQETFGGGVFGLKEESTIFL